MAGASSEEVLSATLVLEYPYTRSTGPVLEQFLTALSQRSIKGIRGADGRVIVPPQEYDPVTSEPLDELVDVADEGVVTTWSWQPEPKTGQPLDHPFAWALVQLDGADTAMLHAVDVAEPSRMSTGMRVKVRWADEPRPHIDAIACFEPAEPVETEDA